MCSNPRVSRRAGLDPKLSKFTVSVQFWSTRRIGRGKPREPPSTAPAGDESGRGRPRRNRPAATAERPTRTARQLGPCAADAKASPSSPQTLPKTKFRLRAYSTHGVALAGWGTPPQKKNTRFRVFADKVDGVGAHGCQSLLPAHFGVGNFAHPGVQAQLVGRLDRVVVLHQQAGRSWSIAQVQLGAEIPPGGHEVVEDLPVPPGPGPEAGGEQHGCQQHSAHLALPVRRSGQHPEPANGQEDQQRRIAEAGQTPKQPQQAQRPEGIRASGVRMRSATTSTQENRKVVSDVSHTQRTAYCMAAG